MVQLNYFDDVIDKINNTRQKIKDVDALYEMYPQYVKNANTNINTRDSKETQKVLMDINEKIRLQHVYDEMNDIITGLYETVLILNGTHPTANTYDDNKKLVQLYDVLNEERDFFKVKTKSCLDQIFKHFYRYLFLDVENIREMLLEIILRNIREAQ